MTGALGDTKTIGKLCSDLGHVFAEFLPDIFQNETGLDIEIGYAGFDTGLKSELIANLGSGVALCDTTLRNWCPDFVISCDSPVIITLMEILLGAPADAIEEPKPRSLSNIELDVATMIFEKVADVLKSAVTAAGSFEPVVGRPYNASQRPAGRPGCRRRLCCLHQCNDGPRPRSFNLLDHRPPADASENGRRVSQRHWPEPQGQGSMGRTA